jgi:hypothetical protein
MPGRGRFDRAFTTGLISAASLLRPALLLFLPAYLMQNLTSILPIVMLEKHLESSRAGDFEPQVRLLHE